ncbi:hypothetical protein LTS18_011539, partial [Coniosporium uncinatum]
PMERVESPSQKNEETIVDPENSGARRNPLTRNQSEMTDYSEVEVKTTPRMEEKRRKWYQKLNPLKRKIPPIPEERQVSREYNAGFFSMLTFQWMAPLMSVGYRRPLELEDLWTVNPKRSVEVMLPKLNESFQTRVDRGDKNPLRGAMYDTFKFDFILGGLCQLTSSVVGVISPFVLKYLISFASRAYYANNDPTGRTAAPPIGEGIGLVFAIIGLQMIQSLCTNHFLYRGMTNGGQARAVLMAAIFEKAMKVSGRAKAGGKPLDAPPSDIKPGTEEERKWYQKLLRKKGKSSGAKKTPDLAKGVSGDGRGWTNGRIVNLMSTDTYRVDTAAGMFHMIWTAPITILLTLALLLINLSYSALAGFALLVIAMPLLGRAVRSLFRRRQSINKITDQRVGLMQEILQAVRFVKYFGWETSFIDRISAIRGREVRSIQKLLAIRNLINAVGMSMPVFASMLAFITYSQTHTILNPAPIFSSLALFNALRMPLNFLPLVIGQVIDAQSSVNRIQEFLLEEEAEDSAAWDMNASKAIVVRDADFTWERTPTQDPDKVAGKGPRSYKQEKKDDKAAEKAAKQAKKDNENKVHEQDEGTDSSSTL